MSGNRNGNVECSRTGKRDSWTVVMPCGTPSRKEETGSRLLWQSTEYFSREREGDEPQRPDPCAVTVYSYGDGGDGGDAGAGGDGRTEEPRGTL